MDTIILTVLIIIAAIALLMGKVQEWLATILAPVMPGITSLGNAFNSGAKAIETMASRAEEAVKEVGLESEAVKKAREEVALLEVQNKLEKLKAQKAAVNAELKANQTKAKSTKAKSKK